MGVTIKWYSLWLLHHSAQPIVEPHTTLLARRAKTDVAREDSHQAPIAVCHGARVVIDRQTRLLLRARAVQFNPRKSRERCVQTLENRAFAHAFPYGETHKVAPMIGKNEAKGRGFSSGALFPQPARPAGGCHRGGEYRATPSLVETQNVWPGWEKTS